MAFGVLVIPYLYTSIPLFRPFPRSYDTACFFPPYNRWLRPLIFIIGLMFYMRIFVRMYCEDVGDIIFTNLVRLNKGIFMNLHEECLLKYLKSPDELGYSTDILKLNNQILEQHFVLQNILSTNLNLIYNNRS